MRDKKACGHERGYRCLCHPNARRPRRTEDLVDLMSRPVGLRLARLRDEAADLPDDGERDDDGDG